MLQPTSSMTSSTKVPTFTTRQTAQGETALHLAARYARSDAAKRLLEASADANIQDNMGRTPLHAAVAADAQGVFQVCEPQFHKGIQNNNKDV